MALFLALTTFLHFTLGPLSCRLRVSSFSLAVFPIATYSKPAPPALNWSKDIKQKLSDLSHYSDLKTHDCIVLVFMSHGGSGYILGADGGIVELGPAFDLFSNDKCHALKGKPKIFIIQACNGQGTDPGVAADAVASGANVADLPTISDMFEVHASLPGFKSWRDPYAGSRFIQSLCDVIDRCAGRLDLGRMITRVIKKVHEKSTEVTQCPCVKSSLSRDVYMCP